MIKKIKNITLLNKPFVIVPEQLQDELLSSWLVRTAYAHYTHPHTFVNLFLGKKYETIFMSEIDVILSKNQISILMQKSLDHADIFQMTLKSYETYLQEKIISNGFNKLLCSLRFCPKCLKADKVPYFRKIWKVAFYTVCSKHKCFMLDTCPECNTKIDISKMYQNKLSFQYCYKCGFDLKQSKIIILNKEMQSNLFLYEKLLDILNKGYIVLGKSFVHSFYFFDAMIQLSKKIIRHGYAEFVRESKMFKSLRIARLTPSQAIQQHLSIKEQYSLNSIIMNLFDNYPRNFERYIKTNKLSHWQTLRDMEYVSFWFENLVNEMTPRLVPITKMITNEEIENGKKYLISKEMIVNKSTMSRLIGCNFHSSYNQLCNHIS